MLGAHLVLTFELRSIRVGLGASSVGNALVPAAIVDDAACFGKLTCAMLPSLQEFAFVSVASGRELFASALGNALEPRSFIRLPILHLHLALPMSLPISELSFVDVSVLEGELTRTMRSTISLRSKVNVASCCLNFSLLLGHLLSYFYFSQDFYLLYSKFI